MTAYKVTVTASVRRTMIIDDPDIPNKEDAAEYAEEFTTDDLQPHPDSEDTFEVTECKSTIEEVCYE